MNSPLRDVFVSAVVFAVAAVILFTLRGWRCRWLDQRQDRGAG